MNFYKHHIGDYAQATAHLSFVEDAAYSRCLRKYYAEESPLPADLKAVQRLVGARTREEKEAVQTVLDEFFTLEADGWHNKRADAELAKANAQAETNRRIAEEREARRKERQASHEAGTNRSTGSNESFHESFHEPFHEPLHESFSVREPSQTPDTRHQTPDATTSGKGGEASASPRPTRKCPPSFVVTPSLLAWAASAAPGVDLDLETSKLRDHTFKNAISDWDGAWRNWVRRAFGDLKPGLRQRVSAAPIDTDTRNAEARRLLGFDQQQELPNA